MFLTTFLSFFSSVLLASNASILSSDTDSADPNASFHGFSFAARATPNADKGSSDNHTLLNMDNMEVRHPTLLSRYTSLSPRKVHRKGDRRWPR